MSGTLMWQPVGKVDVVSEDEPLAATVSGKEIGVYLVGGKHYALKCLSPCLCATVARLC